MGVALALLLSAACGDDEGSAGTGGSAGTAGGGSGGIDGGGAAGVSGTGASDGSSGAGGIPCAVSGATGVTGTVTDDTGAPIAGARVTLFDSTSAAFWEARSDAAGTYAITGVPAGGYSVGASALGREYEEAGVTVASGCADHDFALGPETHLGSWQSLGDPGEKFGGTNSGILLPDGRLMYCHDTLDPVILDPASGQKDYPTQSPKLQGCHAVTVMPDGRAIYVGGADQPVYGPGTRQVKTFDPASDSWQVQPDLTDYRWYPSMVPLPNGELLTVGGGGLNNPIRTNTAEVMNPATLQWSPVGNISIGNEVSPIVLLYTGKVLMTHRPPQFYEPATESWSTAPDFVQGNRMPNGDHADHEMVLLGDGRVVAIGFKTFTGGQFGNFVEIFDPAANQWSLGQNFAPVRSRASTLLLPNEKILVFGGYKEETTDPTPVNAWGQVALVDLYDPGADAWRRLSPMSVAREYHAMPILVPDGRVFVVGGEGEPGNEPAQSTVEAFSPPYLFRGPRPLVSAISSTTLARGGSLTFDIARTNAPTRVILMGAIASTHFMDSGNGRYLELAFTQQGSTITAQVPTDPVRAMYGWYILYAMVDDIPSNGTMVRIAP